MSSPVRTAQSNLSRFQQWSTKIFPICQRHHVFLSTRVHDHIQQETRFVRREIGVVARTKRPKGVQKYHVEFLSPPQAQRVPLRQPEHLRSHQKIDTLGSSDHACHRSCNSRFDEGNQVVDDRLVHNNSTCLRFHGSCRLCQNSCHCCSRDLTCQQISHVVCTSLEDVRSCHNCCTWHCGIDTSLSRVQLYNSRHTLTSRHQFSIDVG